MSRRVSHVPTYQKHRGSGQARERKATLNKRMTPQQIAEGQKLSRELVKQIEANLKKAEKK